MTSDGESDRSLLAAHASGDPHAFSELVARHRDRMWRVALRTLGDPDDAADAVQDALLSAYRGAAAFRGDAAVSTWLHRIAVNACLDLVRRRTSRPATSMPADEMNDVADVASGAAFDDRDTAASVLAGLRRLPTEQSTAVVLVDIEGFSVREAAEILGIPEGTVKSRCARARARLADVLSDLGPGHSPSPARNRTDTANVEPGEPPHPADDGEHTP